MDAYMPALSDPARRQILQLLAAGPLPVHALQRHFAFSQPALSKHLRILRKAGLVAFERLGRSHLYSLRGEAIRETAEWLLELHRFWNERLDVLGDVLDEIAQEEAEQ